MRILTNLSTLWRRLPLEALFAGAGSKEPDFSSKCPPRKHPRNEKSRL
jgi:hypothetical protein